MFDLFRNNHYSDKEIVESLRRREMRNENRINKFRLVFMLLLVLSDSVNFTLSPEYVREIMHTPYMLWGLTFGFLFFVAIYLIHRLTKSDKFRPWIKYVTISIDFFFMALFIWATISEGSPFPLMTLRELLILCGVMFIFLNFLSVLRADKRAIWYSAFLAISINMSFGFLMDDFFIHSFYMTLMLLLFSYLNFSISDHIVNFLVVNGKLNIAMNELKDANVEITQKNEEIEAQRDEIEQQRDFVTTQRDHIAKQKQKLTDSILYASRIQKAVLPPEKQINQILKDYFIMLKPRDIVSGDFYWIDKIDNKIIVAAVDCTGHGVPGAFMSMLGISFLNDIVIKYKTLDAAQILTKLRDEVIKSLHQTGKENETKDGMDIALCIIDEANRRIEFSGAYNPLYHVRKGELTVLKGNRYPIGIYRKKNIEFTNQTLDFEEEDVIYMFSDGYVDQIGGKKMMKFLSKNFKNLVVSIHQNAMSEQKQILEKRLGLWRGEYPQVDDILVLGIRL